MHSSKRDQFLNYVNNPKHKGLSETEKENSHFVKVDNCNDLFYIYIDIKDKKIINIKFEGEGCSISLASMELISSLLKNKNINEVNSIIDLYEKYINGKIEKSNEYNFDIFEIVRDHISRRKCALAPISTIRKVIN